MLASACLISIFEDFSFGAKLISRYFYGVEFFELIDTAIRTHQSRHGLFCASYLTHRQPPRRRLYDLYHASFLVSLIKLVVLPTMPPKKRVSNSAAAPNSSKRARLSGSAS